MTLLARAAETLDRAGVAYAAIGAVALATHGLCRSTFGVDLLTVEDRCLEPRFWAGLADVAVELRRSEASDPLAGAVRLRQHGERGVDIVVGRSAWQREAISRSLSIRVLDAVIPVIGAPDLVLLKLFAGGTLDAWDLAQLLADDDGELADAVEKRLDVLPSDAVELWKRLRGSRGSG